MANRRYTPTAFFRLAAVAFVFATGLLASEVVRRPNPLLYVFAGGMAVVTVFLVLGAFARADFDGDTLVYRVPLRRVHRFDRSQIDHIEIGGRRTRALIIGYHPCDANGRIDVERVVFVNLVPLEEQIDLYEQLGGDMGDGG